MVALYNFRNSSLFSSWKKLFPSKEAFLNLYIADLPCGGYLSRDDGIFLSASNKALQFQSCWRVSTCPRCSVALGHLQHGTYCKSSVMEGAITLHVHQYIILIEGAYAYLS